MIWRKWHTEHYTDKKKIMFGSDFPWASPSFQYNVMKDIFSALNSSASEQEDILYNNALSIFRN